MRYYVDLTRDYDLFPCGQLLPLTTLGYVIHAKGDRTFSTELDLSDAHSFIVEIQE